MLSRTSSEGSAGLWNLRNMLGCPLSVLGDFEQSLLCTLLCSGARVLMEPHGVTVVLHLQGSASSREAWACGLDSPLPPEQLFLHLFYILRFYKRFCFFFFRSAPQFLKMWKAWKSLYLKQYDLRHVIWFPWTSFSLSGNKVDCMFSVCLTE